MSDIKIKKELSYILSPIPRKSREIEIAHGRSIHPKDKKLLAPLLTADILNDVATRTRRHEKSFGNLLVPLHQNKVTKLTKTEGKTFLPSSNQKCYEMSKEVRKDLSKR